MHLLQIYLFKAKLHGYGFECLSMTQVQGVGPGEPKNIELGDLAPCLNKSIKFILNENKLWK